MRKPDRWSHPFCVLTSARLETRCVLFPGLAPSSTVKQAPGHPRQWTFGGTHVILLCLQQRFRVGRHRLVSHPSGPEHPSAKSGPLCSPVECVGAVGHQAGGGRQGFSSLDEPLPLSPGLFNVDAGSGLQAQAVQMQAQASR